VKVLYIVGGGRSGSTLLDNLLGQLDGFVSAGELRQLWQRGLIERRLCGCGVPVPECPFWTAVLREGFGSEVPEPHQVVGWQRNAVRVRHTRRLGRGGAAGSKTPPAISAYVEAKGRLYQAVAAVSNDSVVIDSSKSPAEAALLRLFPEVEGFMVHLVRDPRAVANSWRRQKAQPDRGRPGDMVRYGAIRSTTAWVAANWAAESVRRTWPAERWLTLRYEDFVKSPSAAIEAIAGMVGQPATLPLDEGFVATLQPNHTVSGNPSRFAVGRVEIREDDAWRTALSIPRRIGATLVALPLLGRYGYRLRPRPSTDLRAEAPR
jgi:hypothetical protein